MSMIHLSLTWTEHDHLLLSLLLHCTQQLAAEHVSRKKKENKEGLWILYMKIGTSFFGQQFASTY